MRERLSSSTTFVSKFVFPPLMVLATNLLAVLLYLPHLLPSWLPNPSASPLLAALLAHPPAHILLWAIWAGLVFLVCWRGLVLKRLETDWHTLYISDYARTAAVPLAAIVDIRDNRLLPVDPTAIVLDEDTPFGRVIRFQLPADPRRMHLLGRNESLFSGENRTHPLVQQLRDISRTLRHGRAVARIHEAAGLTRHRRGRPTG